MPAEITNLDPVQPYSLTRSQELIWLGQQLLPDSPLYNMVFTFRFNTSIRSDLFRRAFDHVVTESDGLRSLFIASGASGCQYIASDVDYNFEEIDFSLDSDPAKAAENWVEERKLQPLNTAACCFDTALLRLGKDGFIWYFNQHHLITDVWSTSLIFKAQMQTYNALVDNRSAPEISAPSILDYHRFEAGEREKHSTAANKARTRRDSIRPSFYGMPFNQGEGRSRRLRQELDTQHNNSIESLMQQPSIATFSALLTRFNVFLTVLCAYLARTTNLSVITVGVPVHNRMQKRHLETIGLFIELFPISIDVDEQMSFLDLYRSIVPKTQALLQNAGPGRSRPESARRYNVVLNFINARFEPDDSGLEQVDWVHCDHCDPAHFLRVHYCQFLEDQPAELIFDIDKPLFERCGRPDIAAHFMALLMSFVQNPQGACSSAPMSTTAERRWMLTGYNHDSSRIEERGPGSVLKLFYRFADQSAGGAAVIDAGRTYSFAEINQLSGAMAQELQKLGVGTGDLVAIHACRSAELIVSMLAVLKCGAAFIPLEENLPASRRHFIIEQSQARLVVSHGSLMSNLDGSEFNRYTVELERLCKMPVNGGFDLPHDPARQLAYVMYTSGSTGNPKGVMISHQSLHDYIHWAIAQYTQGRPCRFPLYSSIGFDLTLTSIFVPLCSGGSIKIYPAASEHVDISILDVFEDNQVDIVKLTPAHLSLVMKQVPLHSKVKSLILGGEDLKISMAVQARKVISDSVRIFNEYGPTEATVGCMIHEYDRLDENGDSASVPIGIPAGHARIYLLDEGLNTVPIGVPGEIYIAGSGLSKGYLNSPEITQVAFIPDPFHPGELMYKTGDLGRMLPSQKMVYLSRKDDQFKFHGIRIEKGEIEQALTAHDQISDCHVIKLPARIRQMREVVYCSRCGIASNYPDISFDQNKVCNICLDFDDYRDKAGQYFGDLQQLENIITRKAAEKTGLYDCMMLFSGGKDSTYALYQLSQMGFKVYSMTLDNGFISDSAKANITRIVEGLGIDHVFATTDDMNDIFVDSLKRHCSVCYGCFKTIYTLAMKIARDKGINCIVTGLSRGQFFETRLTKESFLQHNFDPEKIDREVLNARKTYHHVNDIVTRRLGGGLFDDDRIFSQIEFVDFYRYCDVSLTDIYSFLENNVPWIRPQDTGRSTNCTINDTGIYYHKARQGFHNYALPYSWDVRLGLKTREQALDELNDEIDTEQVEDNLRKIGFDQPDLIIGQDDENLVAYYTADVAIPAQSLRRFLLSHLPARIVPNYFVHLQELPLTDNGKVDQSRLPDPFDRQRQTAPAASSPSLSEEKALLAIFRQVLRHEEIGIDDNFFDLGGDSIKAIQISASANQVGITIKPGQLFDYQTISELASVVKKQIPVSARQDSVSGEAPLTPVQKWFFTQPENSLDRFSHSVVIRLRNSFTAEQIRLAVNKLLDHHDVLRHRFERQISGWIQCAVAQRPGIDISLVESTAFTREQQLARLKSSLSRQLDIQRGHLLACAILSQGDGGSDELVIVIHHLAIDAVSWGIFLEDLDLLLKQIIQDQELLLPFKTSAFIDWARTLDDHVPNLEPEAVTKNLKSYHRIVDASPDAPQTNPDSISKKTVAIPMALLRTLNGRKIADRITGLQDWVLAAVARALSGYYGHTAICINVETHGRKEISSQLDTTRTMGWFTCINTLCLDINDTDTVEELILEVYQRSESGFERFLLQSRDSDPASFPQDYSAVLFNFLGSHTSHHYQCFDISERLNLIRSEHSVMQHDFEVNVYEVDESLVIEWSYGSSRHSEDSVTQLLEEIKNDLESIVEKTSGQKPAGAGYSMPDLDQEDLDAITSQLK